MTRRRKWLWAAVGALAIGALGVGAWELTRSRVPDRAPPEVLLDGVDAEVVRAVQKAREAVLQSPRSGTAWGEYGEVLHAHLFNAEALECYAQAELLDPKEPRWPYQQGMIHYPDRPEEALPKLRRAAELAPTKPDVVAVRLAELLLSTGHTDEARERFDVILRTDPNNVPARLGAARAALASGNLDGSAQHALACVGSPYGRKAAHTLLSEVRHRQGDMAGATKEQDAAAESVPDLSWPDPFSQTVLRRKVGEKARIRHATRLMDEGQYGEAAGELQRIVADYPSSAQGWVMLGYLYVLTNDDAAAERALARAVALDPAQPRPHFYLGVIHYRKGNRSAAAARFRDAIALKPDYATAHFNLGLALKEDGHRGPAAQAFRDALRCQPGQSQSHAQLGEMLLQDGQKDDARAHLEDAVRLNPRDKRSAELLAGLKK